MAEKLQNTYTALQFIQLDSYVMIDGVQVPIQFRGGSIENKLNGYLVTTDPKMIAALEKDGGYGKSWIKTNSEVLLTDEPSEVKEVEFLKVPGITSVQKAKEWIVEQSAEGNIRKGITNSQIPNKTTLLALANELKLDFVDLPK